MATSISFAVARSLSKCRRSIDLILG